MIDARDISPVYPATFPRFVQHAIWRFCVAGASTSAMAAESMIEDFVVTRSARSGQTVIAYRFDTDGSLSLNLEMHISRWVVGRAAAPIV
ncbi:MAG: hypothetical protein ACRYGP_26705 [Janthinobacterium lividum]